MFNNAPGLSGSERWVTNYKNDYPYNDVRFVSPRYQHRPKEGQVTPSPKHTGRRHFPNSQVANTSLNFSTGEQIPAGVSLSSVHQTDSQVDSQSGYGSGINSHFASPLTSPRKMSRLTALVQPPWGVQFRNVVPITMYQSSSRPSCAAVGMLARLLGLRMNYVEVNTIAGEEKSEKFRQQVNPAGTIPVINDEGFKLFEYRAILRYLVSKYGYKNNPLYPDDLTTRARIDAWLDYDICTLSPAVDEFVAPSLIRNHQQSFNSDQQQHPNDAAEERLKKLEAALDTVNAHVQVSTYLCGSHLTLADLSVVASLAILDSTKFNFGPNRASLTNWMLRMKGLRQFQDSFGAFYAIMGTLK
ncbi:glutathione S-transferase 1-1-like [Convolutriloba macropyga]|uniref:glutathione S-transferase 1-1-like n=1 Tax=Convolutriloba macropyga TaxID=536237 RepID=UPI003F522EED